MTYLGSRGGSKGGKGKGGERGGGARPSRSFGRGRSASSSASPARSYSSSSRGTGSFSRPTRSGGSSGRRPYSGGRGGLKQTSIDVSKFINKARITEEVEHFIPDHKFSDFNIEASLKSAIVTKGYLLPTPIQDRSIPHILRGEDVVGIADTGSGKTGAFLIPLIDKVLKDRSQRVLIMVPTRELATQIRDELKSLTIGLQIVSTVCVGGVGIGPQMSDLRRKPAFVIGTPGRLKDLIERKSLVLSGFGTVVLDEADRMLDMGFIADMRKVLGLLPESRHTLFFSATLSHEVERLIGEFLRTPARIFVKTGDTSKDVEQDVVRIKPGENKIDVLHDLLIKPEFNKVLIFGRTKHGVEKLAKILETRGFKAESIHGNKTQGKRQKALDLFRRDHVQVLVATDVAARGLDISGVSHVINYELPATDEDYVHRIGRTGRAGKKGVALTFVDAR